MVKLFILPHIWGTAGELPVAVQWTSQASLTKLLKNTEVNTNT
jgi:hypothetical protein